MNIEQRIEHLQSSGKLSADQARQMREAMNLNEGESMQNVHVKSSNVVCAGIGLTFLLLAAGALLLTQGAGSPQPETIQSVSQSLNAAGSTGQANTVLSAYLFLVFVFVPLLGFLFLGLRSCNRMSYFSEQAGASKGILDAALQRRHDLLSNLFSVAREVLSFEKDVQSRSADSTFVADLGKALENPADLQFFGDRLKLIVKDHPAIKSTQNIEVLQQELSASENRILAAREFYNSALRDYNVSIKRFPNFLVAGMTGLAERPYFLADMDATTPASFEIKE